MRQKVSTIKITELASTVTDTDLLELFSGYIVAEPVFLSG